jgi:hypothetical protein
MQRMGGGIQCGQERGEQSEPPLSGHR